MRKRGNTNTSFHVQLIFNFFASRPIYFCLVVRINFFISFHSTKLYVTKLADSTTLFASRYLSQRIIRFLGKQGTTKLFINTSRRYYNVFLNFFLATPLTIVSSLGCVN